MTLGSETAIPLREGYRSVTPSIFVNGAEQFIDFLKAVFGAEERLRVPGTEGTRIRYVEMKIGNSMIELGDASERYPACPAALHVYVPETDGVYRRTLDAGATSLHAVEGMPYGERSGSVKDPFGNHWYTHIPETRRRSTRTCARRAPTGYSRHLAPKSSKCIANRRAARSGTRRSGLGTRWSRWARPTASTGSCRPGYITTCRMGAAYQRALSAGAKSISAPVELHHGERGAEIQDPDNSLFLATPLPGARN
jgi:PhnB protein